MLDNEHSAEQIPAALPVREHFLIPQWGEGKALQVEVDLEEISEKWHQRSLIFLLGGESPLGLFPVRLTDGARDNNVVVSK